METRIKICGLSREADIACVNLLRPELAGFVFARGRRRYVEPEQAARLRGLLSPEIVSVGVFVNEEPETVAELLERGIIGMAQLHGQEDAAYIRRLRSLTDRPLIQAFRVEGREDICRAEESAADFILLDHGAGGTGEAFDWSLVTEVKRPYFLAGGLTPENVSRALDVTGPYAVDISSGVETEGKKDAEKIRRFIRQVRLENRRRREEAGKTEEEK